MSRIVDQHFAMYFHSIPLTKTLNTYNSKTTTPNFELISNVDTTTPLICHMILVPCTIHLI